MIGQLDQVLDLLGYTGADGFVAGEAVTEVTAQSYVWSDLRQKVDLDAAFFDDGVPLVGFSSGRSPQGLRELRQRLWNYGRVPILVAVSQSGVDVYDGIARPDTDAPAQSYAAASQTFVEDAQGLTIDGLRAGHFSQNFFRAHEGTRVENGLIRNLAALRRQLSGVDLDRSAIVDALVGASVVANYLTDRGVLDVDHMHDLCGVETLQAALTGKAETARALFAGLAKHFNGDVFGEISSLAPGLEERDLQTVASFLRGDDLETGQQVLWPYDFSVLPTDLVSTIYEQLVDGTQQETAAYYTPRLLVDVVLDEVLPWDDRAVVRIADLSCGSGAFLTEAFRRIAFRTAGHLGRRLTFDELKGILTSQIFGYDLNGTAARITAFGLYLALLEEMDPPTIWRSAFLPPLVNKTIVVGDSFAHRRSLARKKFDVVIGNPPWKSKLGPDALAFSVETTMPVGDQQLAQAFFWLAWSSLRAGGTFGLLMPAKGMLHNRSAPNIEFRHQFFAQTDVRSIYDLSALRKKLFSGATAPTAIIIGTKNVSGRGQTRSRKILHAAPHVRPNVGLTESLVLAPEEITEVSTGMARERQDLWKTLVWGSLEDQAVIDYMRGRFGTFGDASIDRQWFWGQGFKVSGAAQFDSSFLRGRPMVDPKTIEPFKVSFQGVFERETLHRPRQVAVYEGPRALIKRTLHRGRIAAALCKQDAAFPSGIIGFGGKHANIVDLQIAIAVLNSSLANYWHFLTSASWGVERDTVEENEYQAMPLPSSAFDRDLPLARVALQGADASDADLDRAVYSAYGLGERMIARVDGFMNSRFKQFASPAEVYGVVREDTLIAYAASIKSILTDTLPSVGVSTDFGVADGYASVSVRFIRGDVQADQSGAEFMDPIRILRRTTSNRPRNSSMIALPAGYLVDGEAIFIVKTADTDRWNYSSAVKDAERIFATLAGAEQKLA